MVYLQTARPRYSDQTVCLPNNCYLSVGAVGCGGAVGSGGVVGSDEGVPDVASTEIVASGVAVSGVTVFMSRGRVFVAVGVSVGVAVKVGVAVGVTVGTTRANW